MRVKNKATGLNFFDVYFRKGVYNKAPSMPFTPGMEAVGEVVAVGPGLTGRKAGDIIVYAGIPMDSFTEEQILLANKVVPVPSSISPVIAASVMTKGMIAQFLVRRCFKVEPGHTILVHAAAGGVGSLLCQWANTLGATVSTKEKAAQAKDDGCHHVINYKEEDFVLRVNGITSGRGSMLSMIVWAKTPFSYNHKGTEPSCTLLSSNLNGQDFLWANHDIQGSLACLKTRGYTVSFGRSSGAPDPLPLSGLVPKALFLTRPSLMFYTETREELLETAAEEIIFLKRQQQSPEDAAKETYLGGQLLPISSPIGSLLQPPSPSYQCSYMLADPAEHIKVGSFYEVVHSKLPPKFPDQLISIRVVMVKEKTRMRVSLRFPSIYSLRAYFSETNCTKPDVKKLPALDEKYIVGSEIAAEALYRRIPPHEITDKRKLWHFWAVPSIPVHKVLSSPLNSRTGSIIVSKKGSLWSSSRAPRCPNGASADTSDTWHGTRKISLN
ncbi:hypothetical protein GH714_040371 [Hevea brasiliensis]|uniref:Enoyl reductase (ER) domain-containing protein n=1 Tax=Hevea brasiliensis TaxID=3981 RepID=A0A6A6MTS2_HEVBR|nr:hypothetical protein GH714_040371 [Hevea brasiliensis]